MQPENITHNQEVLLGLWREVLDVSDPSLDSNFFEMGGDSLQMMTLLFRISQDMAVELEPGAVFDNPTPGALADFIAAEQQTGPASEGLI